jgi:hypothetical protein
MTKLNDAQKAFVVERLASHYQPTGIAREVRARYGITVSAAAIEFYDPTRFSGEECPKRWADLFHATRNSFNKEKADIPAANRLVRVRWRGDMAIAAMEQGQYKPANDILDSIAKECGDAFSNRQKHEHSGPNGEALRIDDARERVFRRLDKLRQSIASRAAGLAAARGEKTPRAELIHDETQ